MFSDNKCVSCNKDFKPVKIYKTLDNGLREFELRVICCNCGYKKKLNKLIIL
jgi:hypothetical protein